MTVSAVYVPRAQQAFPPNVPVVGVRVGPTGPPGGGTGGGGGTGFTGPTGPAQFVLAANYGVVANGSTDDTTAIQAAINAAAALTGGGTVLLPNGSSPISATITISTPNVQVWGQGSETNHNSGGLTSVSKWTWAGSAGGTMVSVATPYSGSAKPISGVVLKGLSFHGANTAAIGLLVDTVNDCDFTNLWVSNVTQDCYRVMAGIEGTNIAAGETATQNNRFDNCNCRVIDSAPVQSANGFTLLGSSNLNVSFNEFTSCTPLVYNGAAFLLENADNNIFQGCNPFVAGSGASWDCWAPGVQTSGSIGGEGNYWVGCTWNVAPHIRGTEQSGATTSLFFNNFVTLDKANSVALPTVGTGSTYIAPGGPTGATGPTGNTGAAGGALTWANWSPVLTAGSGSISAYTVNRARYAQQGSVVTVNFDITITTIGSAGTNLLVTLPVAALNVGAGVGTLAGSDLNTGDLVGGYVSGSNNNAVLDNYGAFSFGSGSRIIISGQYEAASSVGGGVMTGPTGPTGLSVSAANPSALVSLATVNGVAVTFMRSDAAPAIDQTQPYTWSQIQTFTGTGSTGTSVRIIGAGNTGISLPLQAMGHLIQASIASDNVFALENVSAQGSGKGSFFSAYHNDGTPMAAGSRLGGFFAGGCTVNGTLKNGAAIFAIAEGLWSSSSSWGYLDFQVVPSGATVPASTYQVHSTYAGFPLSNYYLNFNSAGGTGASGYGFRDNGGTMQVAGSPGSWSNINQCFPLPIAPTGGGQYYLPCGQGGASSTVVGGTGTGNASLYAIPVVFPAKMTLEGLGCLNGTSLASGHVQLALYGSNGNSTRPSGNALANTNSINTTVGNDAVAGALTSNYQVLPNTIYWLCLMADNSTATFEIVSGVSFPVMPMLIGSPTLASMGNVTAGGVVGVRVAAQTFNTWPSLSAATFVELLGNTAPIVFYQVSSVP